MDSKAHLEKKDLCRLEKKNRSNYVRFLWKNSIKPESRGEREC